MEVSEDSRSNLLLNDIYIDIVQRFDAIQHSQALIIQKLRVLIEEFQDLKKRQRERGV
jgi:hypothetical protein